MSSDEKVMLKELDISSAEVRNKYWAAADIINKALKSVVQQCKAGVKIVDICEHGDNFITEKIGQVYKNVKNTEKGIAFPTCISVNEVLCHFSPCSNCDQVLAENDIVKIDMACHIEDFTATVAHTLVISDGAVTGEAANALAAANTAADAALGLVRHGSKKKDVTEAIKEIAAAYNCEVSFRVSNADTTVDDAEFEGNKLYVIDIITSTGSGEVNFDIDETNESNIDESTIYRKAADQNSELTMKSSSFIFKEIDKRFPSKPFSLRWLEDKSRAFLGLTECVINGLLEPYPIMRDPESTFTGHIKFTMLLMPNGPDRITSHQLQELQPSMSIENNDKIKGWVALGIKQMNRRKGKKKGNIQG